jgi:hypothetical protein
MAKVVVVEDDEVEEETPAPVTWYNSISSSQIDKWRIWPRLLISLYGVMFYRTTEWFMTLPEPSNAQSAFISVIVGAGAAWFGLYCGSGGSKGGKDK